MLKVTIGDNSTKLHSELPCGPGSVMFARLIDSNDSLFGDLCQKFPNLPDAQQSAAVLELMDTPRDEVFRLVLKWFFRTTPVDALHVLALEVLVAGSNITLDVWRERASE